jgi:signal recognition particle subunit SRP54
MGDIQQDCIGQNVFKNVTPGQQVVKIVHDRMIEILGGAEIASLSSQKPLKILMVGLHGSGKTTSTVKLAHLLKKMGYSPAVVACDVYRPAAMEQLAILAQQANIPVL